MATQELNPPVTPIIESEQPLFEHEGARGVAVRCLLRITNSDSIDAERLVSAELEAHPSWDPFERALFQELVFGTLRWRAKLDWVLTGFHHGEFPKCTPAVQEALRVALYQILMISKIPPQFAIDSATSLITRLKDATYAGTLAGVLRAIARNVSGVRYPPREQLLLHLSVVYSHPMWLVKRWLERYGEELTEQMLAANLERPPRYLIANAVRTTDQLLTAWLQEHQIPFEVSPIHPRALRINPFTEPHAVPSSEGLCYTAEPVYLVAASLLPPHPLLYVGREISSAILPFLEQATLRNLPTTVWTPYPERLQWLRATCERLGWNAPTIISDEPKEEFSTVCVEAPSSGIGQWRRKPERKWRSDSRDVERAARAARDLIGTILPHVAPGGTLLVMTASTEPEETTGLVDWVCMHYPEFTPAPIGENDVPASLRDASGMIQTLPHHHRCDTVFVARLVHTA